VERVDPNALALAREHFVAALERSDNVVPLNQLSKPTGVDRDTDAHTCRIVVVGDLLVFVVRIDGRIRLALSTTPLRA
jgi:hypothetical protein